MSETDEPHVSSVVALVGAQVAGGVMIATGMRLVFAGDPQRESA
jgi:hypothetical protein